MFSPVDQATAPVGVVGLAVGGDGDRRVVQDSPTGEWTWPFGGEHRRVVVAGRLDQPGVEGQRGAGPIACDRPGERGQVPARDRLLEHRVGLRQRQEPLPLGRRVGPRPG